MKQSDVVLGKVYEVLVSGRPVALRVNRRHQESKYRYSSSGPGDWMSVVYFYAKNLRTGREIKLRASRLRRPLCSFCHFALRENGTCARCDLAQLQHSLDQKAGRAYS
jgi:hypothetical protein